MTPRGEGFAVSVRAPISSARAIISEEEEEEEVGVSAGVANAVVVVVDDDDEDVVRGGAPARCCCRSRKDWIDRGAGGANPRTPQRLSLVRPQLAKAAAVRRVALRVMVWSVIGILLPTEGHSEPKNC